jgi:hypothetical protein
LNLEGYYLNLIGTIRLRVEEGITSSKTPRLNPDEVIEEIRKIREELWCREKKYFASDCVKIDYTNKSY